MNLIVCVDKNWGIGKNNDLLFSIPEDMKFFRKTTLGKVVVMGRKTLESFPQKKPLKDRINIVLTHDTDYVCEDAVVLNSMEEIFKKIKEYPSDDVYVIGGASIYNKLYPYCKSAFVTKVFADANAEVFIDDLSSNPNWVQKDKSELKEHNGLTYAFFRYDNISIG